MTIIEVLLPDGAVRAHTTVEQSYAAIDEEVVRLFPDASHWRLSRDWRSLAGDEQPSVISVTWARAKPLAAVLILAFILTPVFSWAASLDGGSAAVFDRLRGSSTVTAVEADELSTEPVSAVRDVHIVGIDEQASDTSRTLRVHLRNDGAQTHSNVRVQAVFYDSFDTLLPQAEGSVGTITLAPQQDGFVKVWAHSEYGVGQFELEVLDPAP